MEKAIYGVWELFVEAGSSKKEKEGKKGEGKKGKKEREREGEEMGREKNEKRKAVFRWSELVRPRSKACIFDEGWAPRGWDSSYLGFFLSFKLLFWSTFETTLCHVYGMFCGINWKYVPFCRLN